MDHRLMCIFSSLVCRALNKLILIRWLSDLVLKRFSGTSPINVNILKQISPLKMCVFFPSISKTKKAKR